MLLKLHRISSNSHRTQGILIVPNHRPFTTLELPWRENKRNISCIPNGTYPLKLHTSPRFGKTLLVDNVPDRSEILIHSGNTIRDTEGCILVGYMFGSVMDLDAVLNSKQANLQLFSILKMCLDDMFLQVL